MASFVTIDASAMRRIVRKVGAGQQVMAKPLSSTRGQEALKILRFGAKGVRAQFGDQTEYRGNSSIPWVKGHDFGTRKAPAKTMQGSGAYRSAFLGGAGAITEITANSVRIGVNAGKFPQVRVHQGAYGSRRIKPKQKVTSGRNKGQWKMRFFLGLTYGVWMKNSTLSKGLKLPRRRVSVSSTVRRNVAKYLRREVAIRIKSGGAA